MLQRFDAPDSDSEFDSSTSSSSVSQLHKRRRTTASSHDSSGESASGSSGGQGIREVQPSGLLLSQLLSMNEGGDSKSDNSVFAKHGQDANRVRKVLKEPCCNKNCKKNLRMNLIMKMVTFFWVLPKVSQDCVLWSIQQKSTWNNGKTDLDSDEDSESTSAEVPKHRNSWMIEGRALVVLFASCFESVILKNTYDDILSCLSERSPYSFLCFAVVLFLNCCFHPISH